MENQNSPDISQESLTHNPSSLNLNMTNDLNNSNDSFLLPSVPTMLPQISAERFQHARRLMQVPICSTSSVASCYSNTNTPDMRTFTETPNSAQGFNTPTSSGTEEILRRSNSRIMSPFPDNFPLSGPSKYICGPPGGTPFPRYKETTPINENESLFGEIKSEKVNPPALNLTEVDIDSIPIVFDTSNEYELGMPPVPFNTPVTPETQKAEVRYIDEMESSFSTGSNYNIDLDDKRLMSDLCEVAAKLENEEKRKQIQEKQDLKRIVTREHSLEELLNEMPESKRNIITESSYTSTFYKKDTPRRIRVTPKNRPSNKYNDLSLDEVEKLTSVRRQAMEYKGAMSIAEKETVRREKINDSISILRKIIPTVTDTTENTEVFEITARYVAFLKQKSEGKHDRGYLYEHLEL